jgi:hypothetical protein
MAYGGTLALLIVAGPLLAQGNQWQKDQPRRPPVYRATGNPGQRTGQAGAGIKLTPAQAQAKVDAQADQARLQAATGGAAGKAAGAPIAKQAPKKLVPPEHRIGKQIHAEKRH